MDIKFNATGEQRKALVTAISEIAGWAAVYKKAPTFAYVVNNYTIDKFGTLSFDERTSVAEVKILLDGLARRGFVSGDSILINATTDISAEEETTDSDTTDMGGSMNAYVSESDSSDGSGVEPDGIPCGADAFADAPDKSLINGALHTDVDFSEDASPEDSVSTGISIEQDSSGDIIDGAGESVTASDNSCNYMFSGVREAVDSYKSNNNPADDAPVKLSIEMQLDGFSKTALDNLNKLINSKAALIMKALGTDDLPVEITEATIRFPWFTLGASDNEVKAYSQFIAALCEMAKRQKRITAQEKPAESEKFAFRCFLLRLGFIGDEYKNARRILLSKLSGNGSFKTGGHKRGSVPESVTIADSGEDNPEAVSATEGESAANNAAARHGS